MIAQIAPRTKPLQPDRQSGQKGLIGRGTRRGGMLGLGGTGTALQGSTLNQIVGLNARPPRSRLDT